MVKTALVAALAALVLAACGSAGGTGSVPSPSPSPDSTISPGFGFDAVVTEQDRSITIHAGQKLEVVLRAKSGMTDWSEVRSSDTSVLTPIPNPAATAVRGVTLAAFEALVPGQVDITATAGPVCSPGQACPMFAVLFSITVTVT